MKVKSWVETVHESKLILGTADAINYFIQILMADCIIEFCKTILLCIVAKWLIWAQILPLFMFATLIKRWCRCFEW